MIDRPRPSVPAGGSGPQRSDSQYMIFKMRSEAEPTGAPVPPLHGVRVIECSMLGPGALGTHLADLGAEVIKVEPPSGDYVREMTWPIVEGVSLMHLHIARGKRSVVIDLRAAEGVATFLDLVRGADAVVEAMRPGSLERRGLGWERLLAANPRLVFCTISGYGLTGPYRDLPSHGVAYDVWAGLVIPEVQDGVVGIPEHPSVGIHAGPLYGALGVLAGIIRARATGLPCRLEIAQSDAAAAMDWYRSETWRAYERPESEVTGNAADDHVRRAPGTAGMRDGVRYQIYASKDGYVLLQASERRFWQNFCRGVDRDDLFEQNPGARVADHALGNTALRAELAGIFATRTSAEWVELGARVETPIVAVNTPRTIADDPQFRHRLPWLPAEELGADQLPTPLKLVGEELPAPTRAPTLDEHAEEILRGVLGYDDAEIERKRAAGAFG
jgi:crotonobetainyl-CoA:carnitine CoA-transferase CaiB-like acyl-CoA transferase